MAVLFDTYSSGNNQGSEDPWVEWSHTVGDHPNRVIYVAAWAANESTVANLTATCGGTAMDVFYTQTENSSQRAYRVFRLVGPGVGSQTIRVTENGSVGDHQGVALTFYNVSQSDPDDTPVEELDPTGGYQTSVDVTSQADDMVVSICIEGGSTDDWAVGTGETLIGVFGTSATGVYMGAFSYDEGVAGTVTMEFNWNPLDATNITQVGWNLNVAVPPTAAITGTATASIDETDIVAGGNTIIATLTGDTYVVAATYATPAFSTGATKGTTAADTANQGGGGRTGDGTLTCSWPAAYTPTAGHFALMILYNDQGDGSTPTDWTEITGSPFGTDTPKLCIFYKILVGSDAAPVTTISGSGTNISHCAQMAIYTGVGSIGAIGTGNQGTGTPMSATGVTTTDANSIVVFCCGRGDNENSSGQTFNASATGVTEQLDGGTGAGSDSQVSMADKAFAASSSASGDGASTTSATDPWVAVMLELKRAVATTPFASARTAIRDGIDSAQSEATGWDAKVKPNIPVANIVRTSDTVCTITLQAQSDYDITAQETITVTIPASALTGAAQIVGSPTFTVATESGAYELACDSGSFPWTGTAASLLRGYQVVADAATFPWTGIAAGLFRGYAVSTDAGAVPWTGTAATFDRTYVAAADGATFPWTGTVAGLFRGYALAADGVTFSWTGTTADLLRAAQVVADSVTFPWTGTPAALLRGYQVTAQAGAFPWTGTDAELTYTPVAGAYTLNADPGAFAWTGTAASLQYGRIFSVDAGAFTWAGTAAALLRGYAVVADAGAFPWTGTAAALLRGYQVVAEAATYPWTGTPVEFLRGLQLLAEAGAFPWTGTDATLTHTPIAGSYLINAETGTFAWTGTAAGLEFGRVLIAETGAFLWIGTAASFVRGDAGFLVRGQGSVVSTVMGSGAVGATLSGRGAEGA